MQSHPALIFLCHSIKANRRYLLILCTSTINNRLSIAEIAIYRIFQEIFTNIEKHANADYVKIEIKKQNSSVYFQIEDNGKGFDIERIELN